MVMTTGKKVLLGIGILLAIVIVVVLFAYFSIAKSETVKAQVHVISQDVMVNGQAVSENAKLHEGDVVSTGSSGKATIILYESVLISMESNSEVKISELLAEHPVVEQTKGETWTKFTKLSGVQDYSIKTGNSVASVRGTAFNLKQGIKDGEWTCLVGEGEVDYEIDGQTFLIGQKKVVEKKDGKVIERDATAEEIALIKERIQQNIDELRYLRNLEIKKHPKVLNFVKDKYSLTDEAINQHLLDADAGKLDVDYLVANSPIKIESLNKIAAITKAIQKLIKDAEAL